MVPWLSMAHQVPVSLLASPCAERRMAALDDGQAGTGRAVVGGSSGSGLSPNDLE